MGEIETGEAPRRIADNIADRLLEFAARVTKVARELPRDVAGRHIADQLLRSGASPGALYQEARSAESRRDFVHKLSVALKEMRETRYWLQLTAHAGLVSSARLVAVIREADELCRILGKSRTTARRHLVGRGITDE